MAALRKRARATQQRTAACASRPVAAMRSQAAHSNRAIPGRCCVRRWRSVTTRIMTPPVWHTAIRWKSLCSSPRPTLNLSVGRAEHSLPRGGRTALRRRAHGPGRTARARLCHVPLGGACGDYAGGRRAGTLSSSPWSACSIPAVEGRRVGCDLPAGGHRRRHDHRRSSRGRPRRRTADRAAAQLGARLAALCGHIAYQHSRPRQHILAAIRRRSGRVRRQHVQPMNFATRRRCTLRSPPERALSAPREMQ